ncbi:MAG: N-acetylmuramoyl-L-alanine amidase [Tannerella sp.]|jgi:N-acetylmuramoyl-L-alanine amidase|nr:N-acetylmuramoyl-L-alanine amidase [Tannerella sp.]
MRKIVRLTSVFVFLLLLTPAKAADPAFIVVIDPGHGGRDPGARGSSVNEKAINLAVALKLGELITANHKDVKVIYTRQTDVFVNLMERADIANRNKADLFISIHTNSVKNRSTVKGAETFTLGLADSEESIEVAKRENAVILEEENYLKRYGGFDPNSTESYIMFDLMQNQFMEQSVVFASEIQKTFASAKRTNRGVKQTGFLVLMATGMPSVLIELGFISNKEEQQYMSSAAGQNQYARSIYSAFNKYKEKYGLKQGVAESSTITTPARQPTSQTTTNNRPTGQIIYKVQILSSDRLLPANSPLLKGYKAEWYQEGKMYKYTIGASEDFKTIQNLQKQVTKDFKDAFVIRMRDGKRLI